MEKVFVLRLTWHEPDVMCSIKRIESGVVIGNVSPKTAKEIFWARLQRRESYYLGRKEHTKQYLPQVRCHQVSGNKKPICVVGRYIKS